MYQHIVGTYIQWLYLIHHLLSISISNEELKHLSVFVTCKQFHGYDYVLTRHIYLIKESGIWYILQFKILTALKQRSYFWGWFVVYPLIVNVDRFPPFFYIPWYAHVGDIINGMSVPCPAMFVWDMVPTWCRSMKTSSHDC